SNAASPAQRLEIFTGAGRRRAWTAEEKAAIVAETVEDDAVVSHVARRHGLTPQQVFAWRRQARRRTEADVAAPAFTPIVVEGPSPARLPDAGSANTTGDARSHLIELEIGGSSVWVWAGAEVAMVRAIIGALKATK
ncbi:MAG TPA: transposase, partial [Methylocystis sp.]|nr:transposase [Methylocystis sp.]